MLRNKGTYFLIAGRVTFFQAVMMCSLDQHIWQRAIKCGDFPVSVYKSPIKLLFRSAFI